MDGLTYLRRVHVRLLMLCSCSRLWLRSSTFKWTQRLSAFSGTSSIRFPFIFRICKKKKIRQKRQISDLGQRGGIVLASCIWLSEATPSTVLIFYGGVTHQCTWREGGMPRGRERRKLLSSWRFRSISRGLKARGDTLPSWREFPLSSRVNRFTRPRRENTFNYQYFYKKLLFISFMYTDTSPTFETFRGECTKVVAVNLELLDRERQCCWDPGKLVAI